MDSSKPLELGSTCLAYISSGSDSYQADPSLFTLTCQHGTILLLLYVDDIILTSDD